MTQQKDNEETAAEMDYNVQEHNLTAAIAACHEAEDAVKDSLVQAEVERIEAIESKPVNVKKEAIEDDLPDFDDDNDAMMPQNDHKDTVDADQTQGQDLTATEEASDLMGLSAFLTAYPKPSDNPARSGDGLGEPAAANASTLPSPPPPPSPKARPTSRNPSEWNELTDDNSICSTCHIYGKNRPSDHTCAKCKSYGLCNRCNSKGYCLACRANQPGYIEAGDPRWAHAHKTLVWCHTHRKRRGAMYMDEIDGKFCCKPEFQCQCSTDPPRVKAKIKARKVEKGKRATVNPAIPPVLAPPPSPPRKPKGTPL